jgi:hypothetical protein
MLFFPLGGIPDAPKGIPLVYQSCLKIFGAIFCSRHSLNKRLSRGSNVTGMCTDPFKSPTTVLVQLKLLERNMKTAAIIAALVGSASAFAPAPMVGEK